MSSLVTLLNREINNISSDFEVCGVVNHRGKVYSLNSDTKVLSTVFELICRPIVVSVAKQLGYEVVEPLVQNYYPDFSLVKSVVTDEVQQASPEFTLADSRFEKPKIAVDIKTTYRNSRNKFNYTLGGYASFIRPSSERKNIVFPFSDYQKHYIIGFVYSRGKKSNRDSPFVYPVDELDNVPVPIENIEFFVQEKWRIAGDRAGSGNTTNIGSITGTIDDFREGKGPFRSEKEFLTYWRGYERTAEQRAAAYSNLAEFRRFQQRRRI
ncbi:MAG: restriction endonuclease [Gammaproteobacteria bacterium]|nr:restriction endonuclease [Gammaproteobacteria bacterium]